MSRVGVRPIKIEDGLTLTSSDGSIIVSNGTKSAKLLVPDGLSVVVGDGFVKVERGEDSERQTRALHGLFARLLKNALTGIKDGFTKELEFTGTGYRAAVEANELVLNMGYSHQVRLLIPEGLKVAVVKNAINISGSEKDEIGNFAAKVRDVRPPEVYKGKGIKYKGEIIKRKAGKTAASK